MWAATSWRHWWVWCVCGSGFRTVRRDSGTGDGRGVEGHAGGADACVRFASVTLNTSCTHVCICKLIAYSSMRFVLVSLTGVLCTEHLVEGARRQCGCVLACHTMLIGTDHVPRLECMYIPYARQWPATPHVLSRSGGVGGAATVVTGGPVGSRR